MKISWLKNILKEMGVRAIRKGKEMIKDGVRIRQKRQRHIVYVTPPAAYCRRSGAVRQI